VSYLPEYYPIMYGGYSSHAHYSPYIEEAESIYEMFQFDYTGQWWHMGAAWMKIVGIGMPLLLIWRFYIAENNKQSRGINIRRNPQTGQSYRRGEMFKLEY